MAVELEDFTQTLAREVNPPGGDLGLTTPQLVGFLADAFWEARLDGFLGKWTADEDGVITPIEVSTGDIPRELIALVVIYAGIKILRNRIMNLNTNFRVQAGPVEFQRENASNVLTEMLKQLGRTKQRIIDVIENAPTTAYVLDAYATREYGDITLAELVG